MACTNIRHTVCTFMMSRGVPSLYTTWLSLVAKDMVSRLTF